jgi:N6-adenosine-specific RNA methylase IME4
MRLDEIVALPVDQFAAPTAHLYLWCPNALLPEGLAVMQAWGFSYKSNIVWHKVPTSIARSFPTQRDPGDAKKRLTIVDTARPHP